LIFCKGRDKFSREPSGNQASTNVFGFVFISQCGVLFGSLCPENPAEVEKTTKKDYESNEKISNYRINDTGKTLRLVRGKVQFLLCQSGYISILQ
jgi:hypothetical protein